MKIRSGEMWTEAGGVRRRWPSVARVLYPVAVLGLAFAPLIACWVPSQIVLVILDSPVGESIPANRTIALIAAWGTIALIGLLVMIMTRTLVRNVTKHREIGVEDLALLFGLIVALAASPVIFAQVDRTFPDRGAPDPPIEAL